MKTAKRRVVDIPKITRVAVEDFDKGQTIAEGLTKVRIVDEPACGFWKGKTLRLSLGNIHVEVNLAETDEPGWCGYRDNRTAAVGENRAEGRYMVRMSDPSGGTWAPQQVDSTS